MNAAGRKGPVYLRHQNRAVADSIKALDAMIPIGRGPRELSLVTARRENRCYDRHYYQRRI